MDSELFRASLVFYLIDVFSLRVLSVFLDISGGRRRAPVYNRKKRGIVSSCPSTEVAFNPEFSAYGYLIATTGLESDAKLWDGGFEAAVDDYTPVFQQLAPLTGHTAGIFGVTFSADGEVFRPSL